MPVRYSSDLAEHRAVRESAGLFDISHMAEISIEGPGSAEYLDFALVGAASEIAVGKAKYSLICNPAGGIIDDLIVYRLGEQSFLVVANASNQHPVVAALTERCQGFEATVTDVSERWALLAIQGPRSVEILSKITTAEIADYSYYSIARAELAGITCLIARTGYTGEDGFEIYIPVESAELVFDAIMEAGSPLGMVPTGLACRDTLRLEAGMPLYGHELDLDVNPFQAGFGKVVRLDKPADFVGKAALSKLASSEPERVLVGMVGEGKRAARAGYQLFSTGSDRNVGTVTSGSLSPTLGYPIAMGYLEAGTSIIGSKLEVDVRGSRQGVEVVKLPFYKRAR